MARSVCETRSQRRRRVNAPRSASGERNGPYSATLPGIGVIKAIDDTRRLRRILASGRARIVFTTISLHGGRWRISLNGHAADLHPTL